MAGYVYYIWAGDGGCWHCDGSMVARFADEGGMVERGGEGLGRLKGEGE